MYNPALDNFFENARFWKEELQTLRNIILDCGLTEEKKWSVPCYTYNGANVVIIGELKASCVMSFFKGSLLSDEEHILTPLGENTRGVRLLRLTSKNEIIAKELVLKAYIYEAIEVEKAGLKPPVIQAPLPPYPDELKKAFAKRPAFKKAFNALTPDRQRGYLLHFNAAKQSKTREARIKKYMPYILEGRGINEI